MCLIGVVVCSGVTTGGHRGQLPPGAAVEGRKIGGTKVGFIQLLNKPKVMIAYSFTIANLLGSTSL